MEKLHIMVISVYRNLVPITLNFSMLKNFVAGEDLAYTNMEKYDPVGWACRKICRKKSCAGENGPRLFTSSWRALYDTKWIDEVNTK